MTQIQYPNDVTGSIQITHGSDGRLNVSSRSDARAYYNSRDQAQTYSFAFEDTVVAVGDEILFLKNDSVDKTLVVNHIGIGSTVSTTFTLQFEIATDLTGTAIVPANLNKASSNAAVVTCIGGTAALGGTSIPNGLIEKLQVGTLGHEDFHVDDLIRLGQGDGISIKSHRGGTSVVDGVVVFYFE